MMMAISFTKACGVFISVCILWSPMLWAQSKNSRGGMLDFNLYPYLSDVDNDSVFTLNIANNFDGRISYFSLLNLIKADDGSDSVGYYTEQNLRWQIAEGSPLDLTLQLNFRSGDNNDRHRLGLRWRLNDSQWLNTFFEHLHLSYFINFHLIQFDQQPGKAWQMEHSFRLTFPYWTERAYLAGFIDHTFSEDLPDNFPDNPAVAEIQFGYRIIDNLYAVTEYRINQYRRSDVNNLAVGLEYKILW